LTLPLKDDPAMLKELFNRAELSAFSGLNNNATYRLEDRGIITSIDKQFTYGQVIFCRVLDQTRKALGAPKMTFAEGFGSRGQYEIDWENAQLIFFSEQGAGVIPAELDIDFSTVIDEWLLPVEKEVFCVSSDDKNVRAFFGQYFRFVPKQGIVISIVVLPRVRSEITKLADKKGVLNKIIKSMQMREDYALIA
jgi:hypothetical protein